MTSFLLSFGTYTLTPALPPGLSFNNNTGVISGFTPEFAASVNYIVTAYNSAGIIAVQPLI